MGENKPLSAKERIVTAAKDRFLREGFSKVPVDELVSELAMSKKTFYKCFNSKDELLAQVVDRIVGEIENGFLAILHSDCSFVQKLDGIMMFMGTTIGRVFRPFMQDLQRHAPHLWHRVQEFRREQVALNFMTLIKEGMAGGHVRQDINPRILYLAFLGTVENILVPSVLMNESFSVHEAMQNILSILFYGILTKESGEQLLMLHRNPVSQSS